METIVNSESFMKLYNQVHKINPEPSPVIPDIAQSIATTPAPVSPSDGTNVNLGKTIPLTDSGLPNIEYLSESEREVVLAYLKKMKEEKK